MSSHLNVVEHIGVVADLFQLHDGVHQRLCSSFALRPEMENCQTTAFTIVCLLTPPKEEALCYNMDITYTHPLSVTGGKAGVSG